MIGSQHIIPTLWIGERPEDIPYQELKPPYVIKVSHGSGGNIFIRKREDIKPEEIAVTIRDQLNKVYGKFMREWAYAGIPRRILIERMMQTANGEVPEDYKFFVFGGKAKFIQVDSNRFSGHTRNLYDLNWSKLPVSLFYPTGESTTPPSGLPEMLEMAEEIGGLFTFARVDLYSHEGNILFGEVTFYPGTGMEKFNPPEWDAIFGSHWQMA